MKTPCARPFASLFTPPFALWAIAALGLFAAACAQTPVGWHKPGASPGASKEQGQRDQSACRFNARRQADKRFRQLGSQVGSPVYSTAHTLTQDMAVLEARMEERRLFESCLKALGYTKKKPPTRKE